MSMIMGLINHQTEAEKAQQVQNQGAQQRQTDLYDSTVAQPGGILARNSAINTIGGQDASQWGGGITPMEADTMVGPDGTYRSPEELATLRQTHSNLVGGAFPSNTSATVAGNNALIAQAGLQKQNASAQTSPNIASNLAAVAANQAQDSANKSQYPLDSDNQQVARQAYGKGLLATLAGNNRSVFDTTQDFQPGSRFGYVMNPRTGVADVAKNPTPTIQQQMLTGDTNNPVTNRPMVDPKTGEVVGLSPHYFDPNPQQSQQDVARPASAPMSPSDSDSESGVLDRTSSTPNMIRPAVGNIDDLSNQVMQGYQGDSSNTNSMSPVQSMRLWLQRHGIRGY